MTNTTYLAPDAIRTLFSGAMSNLYRKEVPQYGTLLDLVAEVNGAVRDRDPALDRRLAEAGELDRLGLERHAAIRLGTTAELNTMGRLFAVMEMAPVGYYDLSAAGVPVHATAFRPVTESSLKLNPFRVFTSLLRMDLISEPSLRAEAASLLESREVFTPGCMEMIARAELDGGLGAGDAEGFVAEALETFRWHTRAIATAETYRRLRAVHTLVADVTCFRGPHINHLTPRTLDIDAVQSKMVDRGMGAKAVIEGPPPRKVPILLRQTSFKALEEQTVFADEAGTHGTHTARFGEVEQRGVALKPTGRSLYDRLLDSARVAGSDGSYVHDLAQAFEAFPDDEEALRRDGLAYFRYVPTGSAPVGPATGLEARIGDRSIRAEPITYEDFLPVSAAGIFQSNLGDGAPAMLGHDSAQGIFETALGRQVIDPFSLYEAMERTSIKLSLRKVGA